MSDSQDKIKNTGGIDRALFREWLEKLQQESWQLELIISGFVLYGIYNSRGAITQLEQYNDLSTSNIFLNLLETLVTIGWRIFFINLLLHVILRSLWIGAIGLRYVSGEIDYEKLNYSNYFSNYLKKRVGDYDDFIEKLEKICSIIFSYTFLLFLFFGSVLLFLFFMALPILIGKWMGLELEETMIYFLVAFFPYLIGGTIVFLDFVTLGGLRRIKDDTFSKIYMPLFWFYSTITLSFLYRPLLYNFIDDKYTRRLFFFSFPYIFLIATCHNFFSNEPTSYLPSIESMVTDGQVIYPKYYDDLYLQQSEFSDHIKRNEYVGLPEVRLSHYKVVDEYITLFVRYNRSYEEVLEKKHQVNRIFKKGWNFTLFTDHPLEEDSLREVIKEEYSEMRKKMSRERSSLRDSIRKAGDNESVVSKLENKRDSLLNLINSIEKRRDDDIDEYEDRKEKEILKLIKEQISLSIDDIDYTDSLTSYISLHPSTGEKGMQYIIPMAHIEKGDHKIYIEQIEYLKENGTIEKDSYILPILKMN